MILLSADEQLESREYLLERWEQQSLAKVLAIAVVVDLRVILLH